MHRKGLVSPHYAHPYALGQGLDSQGNPRNQIFRDRH